MSTRPIKRGEEIGIKYGDDEGVKQFLEHDINFKFTRCGEGDTKMKLDAETGVMYGEFLTCAKLPAGKLEIDFEDCYFEGKIPKQKATIRFKKKNVLPKVKGVQKQSFLNDFNQLVKAENMCYGQTLTSDDEVPETPSPSLEIPATQPNTQ
jgi:hypothetical protein